MKRRNLLTGAAALATGGASAAMLSGRKKKPVQTETPTIGAPAISKNRKQLRMVTSWPKDFPGLGIMPVRTAEYIKEMTNGQIEIKVFSAGELVGATEVFDAVSTGAADMYHAADYYFQGKAKGLSFFTAVPMGLTTAETIGWIHFGGGQELWDELSGGFNIKPLSAGNTGHQMGGWFKKEVNTLEDFKGLKMRIPGMAGEVIRRMGGAAVRLSGGEIYQALQSGAIDATEWVGPWNDLALGFYREAPYYYGPGFHEPGAALTLGINLDIWNGFTRTEQEIIKGACHRANDVSIGEYTYENGRALTELKQKHSIAPRLFSKEIWDIMGTLSDEIVAEIGNSDAQTKRIYDSYMKAREYSRPWTELSDGAYIEARRSALAGG